MSPCDRFFVSRRVRSRSPIIMFDTFLMQYVPSAIVGESKTSASTSALKITRVAFAGVPDPLEQVRACPPETTGWLDGICSWPVRPEEPQRYLARLSERSTSRAHLLLRFSVLRLPPRSSTSSPYPQP